MGLPQGIFSKALPNNRYVPDLRISLSIASSMVLHAAAFAWLGMQAPGPHAGEPAPATLYWIDTELNTELDTELNTEVEPAQPSAPAAAEPDPAEPATAPPEKTPRLAAVRPRGRAPAPAEPDAPATATATVQPEVPRDPAASPTSGLLSMRATGPAPSPDRDATHGTAPGPPQITARQAARLAVPDPGPVPFSPLAPPRPRKPPRLRSEIEPDGKGAYRADDLTFSAQIDRDGRVHINDKPNLQAEGAVPLSGSFDLTDWIMRSANQDPYFARKALFLDRTREERAAMSAAERTVTLRDAISQLPEQLHAIWSFAAWSPEQRRRVLFELWDECAEQGRDQPGEVARAGQAARITIVAFIRKNLPAQSQLAYTPAEIRALNQRRKSRQRFAPYP